MNMDPYVVLALAAVSIVFVVLWIRALKNRAVERVKRHLQDDEIILIDESANCFGVESAGVMQIRGNGCLALTGESVHFSMWLPRKEVQIPRAAITGIETPISHLMKSKGRRLLKIHFKSETGAADSVAWLVRDLAEWVSILQPCEN